MGLTTVWALIQNGVTMGAALTATYGAVGAAVIRLAASMAINHVANRLAGRSQEDTKRDLRFPTSLPEVRFPYGLWRAPGTVLPWPVVGEYAYACWLVSSRESHGEFSVYLDNRLVELSGDPYDMTGAGAVATNDPFLDHVTIWIGRGDQTQPPQVFLTEAGWIEGGDDLLWKASDAGKGTTLVFARLKAGRAGQRSERWPASTPQLDLEGKFTKVWDMRDPAQDPDDPATWEWRENLSLCTLDAARMNPFRPYDLTFVMRDQFEGWADSSDDVMPLQSGGSEPRYTISGVVVFDGSEIEDLLTPMAMTGAARLSFVGGRLGVIPGAWRTPLPAIEQSLDGLSFKSLRKSDDLWTQLRVTYSPLTRGGEAGELRPWDIPGAAAADGGNPKIKTIDLGLCRSGTQAQRVRNILGKQNRLQKSATLVAPPRNIEAMTGSIVPLGLPDPYGTHMNGTYEVAEAHPAADPVGSDGYALRCPVVLIETSQEVFAWDPATDEEPIVDPPYDGTRDGVQLPGVLSVTSGPGVDLDTGGAIIPRFRFAFDPSGSAGVLAYEWEWKAGTDAYQSGGSVDAEVIDGVGDVFFHLPVSDISQPHAARVRTVAEAGRSDWRDVTGIYYAFTLASVVATAGAGEANFTATAPASAVFRGVRVYRGAVGSDLSAAAMVLGLQEFAPGAAIDVTAGPMASGSYDFWLVPVTQTGSDSGSAGPFTLTIT
ncbi:hypothetical protein TG4357_02648 [Thalassovita gelatinovora]|uniref:Tip attachment protein J domain-containing protein n=1 Tax=Thalassovita gelatinovora TaxID=53501 RepID=A0A0P1G247_THAGE|nr:hypothetical protein [Thalassovita gelatinovora]QIZ79773.1 hypothetical protein HFZ77_04405 [Thalassovita gelatinovora]CUH66803.1 hypothetical protein TG4357_02648 [Thalassovita gelatinovora]SEQ43050.1 hypothetical protein SAMN04488043_105185 [Thalassovita gelatinovora]